MDSTTKWIIGGIAAFIVINSLTKNVNASGQIQSLGTYTGTAIGSAVGETTAATLWSVPSSYFNWFVDKGEQLSESLWNLGDDNKLFG